MDDKMNTDKELKDLQNKINQRSNRIMSEQKIGLYTCDCHLFENYEEARKAKNQKLSLNTEVKHRCSGEIGTIDEICGQGYVIVKYGLLPKDKHLEHVQELIARTGHDIQNQKKSKFKKNKVKRLFNVKG